jgi:hypothetical protein
MSRGKARPLKQVVDIAVQAAKAAGLRVRISTGDAVLDFFPQDEAEPPVLNGDAEANDFDVIIARRKGKAHEEKP